MSTNSTWLITAKTNLHVGNENNSSYGLIDKAIQRDVLTELPCINSSSLKGAINEYCTQEGKLENAERLKIFGVDKSKKDSTTQKGGVTFLDAKILLLPVQNETTLFHWVTTDYILKSVIDVMDTFGIHNNFNKDTGKLKDKIKIILNDSRCVKVVTDEDFKKLCKDENLPIIARNKLEDGLSDNLWYEQVLPAQTVFYTSILCNDDILAKNINGKIIQIGANATIGYGYCEFKQL